MTTKNGTRDSPSFCWDRGWTKTELIERLRTADEPERDRLMAWILREALTAEVWEYVTPKEVDARLERLLPRLGRKREFWRYLFGKWHELGKL